MPVPSSPVPRSSVLLSADPCISAGPPVTPPSLLPTGYRISSNAEIRHHALPTGCQGAANPPNPDFHSERPLCPLPTLVLTSLRTSACAVPPARLARPLRRLWDACCPHISACQPAPHWAGLKGQILRRPRLTSPRLNPFPLQAPAPPLQVLTLQLSA